MDASKTLSAPLTMCNCGVGMGRALTFVAFAIGCSDQSGPSGRLGQALLDDDVPGKVGLLQAARCCLSFGCASFLHIFAFARSVRGRIERPMIWHFPQAHLATEHMAHTSRQGQGPQGEYRRIQGITIGADPAGVRATNAAVVEPACDAAWIGSAPAAFAPSCFAASCVPLPKSTREPAGGAGPGV